MPLLHPVWSDIINRTNSVQLLDLEYVSIAVGIPIQSHLEAEI